jgi:hypothetical protein
MNSKPNKLKTTKRLREEKMRIKKERQWEIKEVELWWPNLFVKLN